MKNSDSRQAYTFHVTSLKHRRSKYIPPSNRIWWPSLVHFMQQPSHLDLDFLLSCVLSGCPYCRHFLYHCRPKYLPPSNRIIIVAQISFTLESYMMTMPLYISCNVSVAPNIFHPFHPQIIYDDHAFMVGFAPLTSLYMMIVPLWSALLLLPLYLLIIVVAYWWIYNVILVKILSTLLPCQASWALWRDVKNMKHEVSSVQELTVEERNLLSVAYKNVIDNGRLPSISHWFGLGE